MTIKEFDSTIENHFKNLIQQCIHYANNNINKIDNVYIYISFEWVIYFDVFYRVGGLLYERHKLNNVLPDVDVSISKQDILISYCNDELAKVKELFINNNKSVPTQIKIIYSPSTKKRVPYFSYENHHSDASYIGDAEVAEKWFNELSS